jgi:hypothetical protein
MPWCHVPLHTAAAASYFINTSMLLLAICGVRYQLDELGIRSASLTPVVALADHPAASNLQFVSTETASGQCPTLASGTQCATLCASR